MGAGAARAKLAALRPNAAFEQSRTDLGQKGYYGDDAMWMGQYGNRTKVTGKGSMPASAVRKSAMQKDVALMMALMPFGGAMGGAGIMGGAGAAFSNNKGIMEQFDLWRSKGMQHSIGSAGFGRSSLMGASMAGGLGARRDLMGASPLVRGSMSLSGMHQGAYDQNNLLRHGELRRFRNARVAMGLEQRRPGETANGDRQRARQVVTELERKKQHAGSSEQLLSDIAEYTDETQKIMKKAFQ